MSALPAPEQICALREAGRLWRWVDVVAAVPRPPSFADGPGLGGRFRGALGRALRRRIEAASALERRRWTLFPMPDPWTGLYGQPLVSPPPAGNLFVNPTRPWVMRCRVDREQVVFGVRLFGWACVWQQPVKDAVAAALAGGVAVADGARARARLPASVEVVEGVDDDAGQSLPALAEGTLSLVFETPYVSYREKSVSLHAETLVNGAVARIAAIAAWHGLRLEHDWADVAHARETLTLSFDGMVPGWRRRSAAQPGRSIPGEGFTGVVRLSGDVAGVYELLRLGTITHLGSRTTFGQGRYRLA